MAGMFRRAAAMSMPGVTLSQLEMRTKPSSRCACAMTSTESAMSSLLGRLYRMPSCPMAIPSQTAMVLNSKGVPPAVSMPSFVFCASCCRCVCPGTRFV